MVQLNSPNKMGFWEAMTLHSISIPLDALMVVFVTGWFFIIVESGNERLDTLFGADMIIGYIFLCLSVSLKVPPLFIFAYFYDGL